MGPIVVNGLRLSQVFAHLQLIEYWDEHNKVHWELFSLLMDLSDLHLFGLPYSLCV